MTASHRLSIIIVNWNSVNYVRTCLATLYQRPLELSVQIIVIDNASHDGCREMVASEFPDVDFIQSKDNLGFSGANNFAFKRCTGDLVLFLNPDTEIFADAIECMTRAIMERPDTGVIGPQLLNSDGTVQTSCIQKFPSIMGIILDSDLLRNRLPQWSLWGMQPLFTKGAAPIEVDAISGACQMMRRESFERAEMYNTHYFMYAEDVDLCFRMRQLGLKNLYVPKAVVIHHGGQSSKAVPVSGWSAILMRESWKRFFEQHRSSQYARIFQAAVALQAAFRVILISLAMIGAAILRRENNLSLTRKKWKSVLRWSLGFERWVNSLGTN